VSDDFNAPLPDSAGQPAVMPEKKPGFLSTSSGKIIAIVVAVGALAIIAGIVVAIVIFVFGGQVVDDVEVRIQPWTPTAPGQSASDTATIVAAQPAAAVSNSEVFTFRDIFEPLLKPIVETTATVDGGTDDVTPAGDDVLYIEDIISEGGELKVVATLNGTTYTLGAGDSISGTPWQVLSVSSTQVIMLYGDVQITLTIGQGITK
jgi:uncharacterized integral membrane protein